MEENKAAGKANRRPMGGIKIAWFDLLGIVIETLDFVSVDDRFFD